MPKGRYAWPHGLRWRVDDPPRLAGFMRLGRALGRAPWRARVVYQARWVWWRWGSILRVLPSGHPGRQASVERWLGQEPEEP